LGCPPETESFSLVSETHARACTFEDKEVDILAGEVVKYNIRVKKLVEEIVLEVTLDVGD
jgi:hypothetical protein